METFFGKGKRFKMHGEAVFMILCYLFMTNGTRESEYKKRIVKEHESPQEFLLSIFIIGNPYKATERSRNMMKVFREELEDLWSS